MANNLIVYQNLAQVEYEITSNLIVYQNLAQVEYENIVESNLIVYQNLAQVEYEITSNLIVYQNLAQVEYEIPTKGILDIVKIGNYFYLANYYTYALYKFDLNFNLISTLDIEASFGNISGISNDESNLYLSCDDSKIRKCSLDGTILNTWDSTAWYDIVVDSTNSFVYTLDSIKDTTARIIKYDTSGNILDSWSCDRGLSKGINIDSTGNVWVASYNDSYIQKFTSDGVLIQEWDIYAETLGKPQDVSFDSTGCIYILLYCDSGDRYNIAKYNPDMTFIKKWSVTYDTNTIVRRLCLVDV